MDGRLKRALLERLSEAEETLQELESAPNDGVSLMLNAVIAKVIYVLEEVINELGPTSHAEAVADLAPSHHSVVEPDPRD